MIRMSVGGFGLDPRTLQPIVLLNDEAKQQGLPIWIGTMEARAISQALGKVKSRRPTAHDLLLATIAEMNYKLKEVRIDRLDANAYCATLNLVCNDSENGSEKLVDARPSDAITLALQVGAPILVSPTLVVSVSAQSETEIKEELEFKEFVKDLKASDFNNIGIAVSSDEDDSAEGATD